MRLPNTQPGECACSALRSASRAVTRLYDEELKSSGLLATQYTLLSSLERLGPLTMSHLAQKTVLDRTTLTRNLRPLDRAKYARSVIGQDGRERIVEITEAGRQVLRSARPLWQSAQRRVGGRMGSLRIQKLVGELHKLVESVGREKLELQKNVSDRQV